MIELHQFAPHFGLPNSSPFCMKLEAFLRMADIEYELKEVGDPSKGPNGKAPWIVDDGETIPDSRLIIKHLNRKHDYPLRKGLGDEELARHHTIIRMLDESTYWVMVYERWIAPENAPIMRDALLGSLPAPMRKLVFKLVQNKVRKSLHGQGTGRLSREEINVLGKEDIDALAHLLGDKPYFGGEKAAEVDATTMAYLAGFIKAPMTAAIVDHIKDKPNLMAYHKRMMEQVFPDFAP